MELYSCKRWTFPPFPSSLLKPVNNLLHSSNSRCFWVFFFYLELPHHVHSYSLQCRPWEETEGKPITCLTPFPHFPVPGTTALSQGLQSFSCQGHITQSCFNSELEKVNYRKYIHFAHENLYNRRKILAAVGLRSLSLSLSDWLKVDPAICFIQQEEGGVHWQIGRGKKRSERVVHVYTILLTRLNRSVTMCWWTKCGLQFSDGIPSICYESVEPRSPALWLPFTSTFLRNQHNSYSRGSERNVIKLPGPRYKLPPLTPSQGL